MQGTENFLGLTGRVAIVTGAAQGIGLAIARRFAAAHAAVAIADINAKGAEEAVQCLLAQGLSASAFACDVSDSKSVKRAFDAVFKRYDRIDILVNNAGGDVGSLGITGQNAGKPLVNDAVFVALEDVRTILDRNFLTCVLCCREVVPEMIERKSGWVVNLGSISGLSGHSSEAIYASAKAAVHEYTRCLAALVREHNVRANAIAPGLIVVPRILAQGRADNAPKMTDGTLKRPGYPIEIAKAVEYLVTDDSSYMTGQVLRVDGGFQMWPA